MHHEPHALTRPQRVYFWLALLNTTALLLANIVGVKLFRFDASWGSWSLPIEHTVGMLPFPLTFLLTDLLNEYFGRRAARRVAYASFAMAALAWFILYVSRKIPILEGIPGTATQEAYEVIFGAASLMYLASITAFLIGNLLDIYLFDVFKRMTGGKYVWFRATGSTVISQVFDSLIVTFMFFQVLQRLSGQPAPDIGWTLRTAATGYILKGVIALGMTPAIYAGRWFIQRFFGLTPLPADHTR